MLENKKKNVAVVQLIVQFVYLLSMKQGIEDKKYHEKNY